MSCNPRVHNAYGDCTIPVCIQGLCVMLSPYAYWDLHDPHMHTWIAQTPVCIRGLHDMLSPYAYGDQDQSLYAYGDRGLQDM